MRLGGRYPEGAGVERGGRGGPAITVHHGVPFTRDPLVKEGFPHWNGWLKSFFSGSVDFYERVVVQREVRGQVPGRDGR